MSSCIELKKEVWIINEPKISKLVNKIGKQIGKQNRKKLNKVEDFWEQHGFYGNIRIYKFQRFPENVCTNPYLQPQSPTF